MRIIVVSVICLAALVAGCQPAVDNLMDESTNPFYNEPGVADVGTVVNNPKMPSSLSYDLFPDFAKYMPESDLLLPQDTFSQASQASSLTAGLVMSFISKRQIGFELDAIERLGEVVTAALADAGVTIDHTTQSVVLPETEENFMGAFGRLEVKTEAGANEYTRLYFHDRNEDHIIGTALSRLNAEGRTERGVFVMVRPWLWSEGVAGTGARLLALAYDFSNPEQALLTVREERFHKILQTHMAVEAHFQCQGSLKTCVAEHLEITSPSPERTFGKGAVRMSWTQGSDRYCFASVSYHDGSRDMGDTMLVQGSSLKGLQGLVGETCSFPFVPVWDDRVFTTSDLVMRYEDTDPPQGTAGQYYLDGTSQTGWEGITTQTIKEWLDY